jgi:hypothetical protein
MRYLSFFRSSHHVHLVKDLFVIFGSIVFALILAKSGVIYWVTGLSQELRIIGTFVAGLFFTSVATLAPAGVALAEIAKTSSIFWTAFFGAIGAACGDLLIFGFVKDRVSEDLAYLLSTLPTHRYKKIFHERMFRWVLPLLGAIIIASPLPDELGITLLGLSKMKVPYFIMISFTFNFIGIFVLGMLVK